MKHHKQQILWILFTLAVAAVITYFSCQSGEESGTASRGVAARMLPLLRLNDTWAVRYYLNLLIRKAAHFALYAALGCGLLGSAFDQRRFPCLPASVALGAAFAILDEVHQGFVPGRVSTVHDAVIDICGVLAGSAVTFYILRRTEKRRRAAENEK